MNQGQRSKTAEWVAQQRAAHQFLDALPHLLEDPIAVRLLSAEQRAELSRPGDPKQAFFYQNMRAFAVVRSRYAEDVLARAVAAGVGQYVLLGAGLDTFAYRNPFPSMRVFEVDHPSSQAWKRERLAAASIPIPEHLTFAPLDFESQSLEEGLGAARFQWDQTAFFCWLGVTYYLTPESFQNTLAFIAARPPGSGLALDYITPREELGEREKHVMDEAKDRVASMGEPFKLYFTPEQMEAQLTGKGFTGLEDLDRDGINARYFAHRTDGLRLHNQMGRLVSAWCPAR